MTPIWGGGGVDLHLLCDLSLKCICFFIQTFTLASGQVSSRVIFCRSDPIAGFLNASGAGGVSDGTTAPGRDGGCFLKLLPRTGGGGALILAVFSLAP